MHIVEVHRSGKDLVEPMGRMRDWLDAQRMTPRLFEFNASAFRVAFATARDRAPGRGVGAVILSSVGCPIRLPRSAE